MQNRHSRLHHSIPSWVQPGSPFHIRISTMPNSPALTSPEIAPKLLESARLYHEQRKWYLHLFLLMPDHVHAILSFPRDSSMGRTIGVWKRYHSKATPVGWQDNFFDHRLRNDDERVRKAAYIRMNPVAAGLCGRPEDWEWVVGPLV